MRQQITRAAVLAGALLLAAVPAAAAESSECGTNEELVTVALPDVVRAGEAFTVRLSSGEPEGVRGLLVTVDGRAFPGADGVVAPMTVEAPARSGAVRVVVSWSQPSHANEEGCVASAAATLPVVASDATIGRRGPRLGGRWRVELRPIGGGGLIGRYVWRFRPACDLGVCAATVTGVGQPFRVVPDARLVYRDTPPRQETYAACAIERDGRQVTIRNAYVAWGSHRFSVTGSVGVDDATGSLATRLRGVSTVHYRQTRVGRASGCTNGTVRYSLTAVRL